MSAHWYTYHSHPHKEDMLAHQIECHDMQCYYPRLTVTPVNPRSRRIRPYFPGYLFVYTDLETVGFSTIQYMPYSTGLVEFGGEPAVVPDELIVSLQKRLQQLELENKTGDQINFKPGDPVVITGGVLDGYEAIFDASLSGKERSRILIKTLNHYAMKMEVSNKTLKRR
jgi:transcriptional antiterminator RfaH